MFKLSKKRFNVTLFIIVLVSYLGLSACSMGNDSENGIVFHDTSQENSSNDNIEVSRRIQRAPSSRIYSVGELEEIPEYDSNINYGGQVDLRGASLDTVGMNIDQLDDLMHAIFDSETKWPEYQLEGFNPNMIMEMGKNPGLQIRKLHEQGVTGEGVGIAIIDYALLVDHVEYKDNLKVYEEIHHPSPYAHFHGSGVASLAVGKTIGVAPEADLYFIGCQNFDWDFKNKTSTTNFEYTAQAIERVLVINKSFPENRKIRVISISTGWNPQLKGYEAMTIAIEKAKSQGIFVTSVNLFEYNEKFHFHGLDRYPTSDPDDFASFKVIDWDYWISMISHIEGNVEFYEENYDIDNNKKILLLPTHGRTIASAGSNEDYAFWAQGGWSWTIPQISGLYVLACQVKPDITPEEFWNTAYKTGISIDIQKDGNINEGRIVNPNKLIESLGTKSWWQKLFQ